MPLKRARFARLIKVFPSQEGLDDFLVLTKKKTLNFFITFFFRFPKFNILIASAIVVYFVISVFSGVLSKLKDEKVKDNIQSQIIRFSI